MTKTLRVSLRYIFDNLNILIIRTERTLGTQFDTTIMEDFETQQKILPSYILEISNVLNDFTNERKFEQGLKRITSLQQD